MLVIGSRKGSYPYRLPVIKSLEKISGSMCREGTKALQHLAHVQVGKYPGRMYYKDKSRIHQVQ